jgi:hypothetical protein
VAPVTVNPVPATPAALMVTAEAPVEERVTVWVVAAFTFTLPKDRLDELTPSAGVAAFSCRAKVLTTPLALAVMDSLWAVLTAETVIVKLPVADPAATVTLVGPVTAELLLARLTA